MSTLNVDKVDPSSGTALEIGSSGDTITIPSGATIVNSGTATGFGAALTGSTNNTIPTVTGANAISGETNLTFDGTDLTLGTGSIVFGTASKGVYLGVTTGTAANLLDDYETGTWTPTCATGGASPSYSSQDGRYTKVGNMVYLEMHLNFTSSSTNTMTVGSLPFTVKNSEPTPLCMLFKENGSATFNTFILSQGNTLAYPRVLNGSANMTVDQWTGIAMRAVMMYTQD